MLEWFSSVGKMLLLKIGSSGGMQDALEFSLYIFEIAAIFLDFGLGVLLARRTVKNAKGYMRKYYLCVTGLFSAHGFYELSHVIYNFTNYGLVFDIGVFLLLSSVVLLVAAIESAMYTRSRNLFTIFGCVALCIILVDVFVPFHFPIMPLMVWVQLFANPILVAFILLNYIAAARRAKGSARRNVFLIIIAIILFAIAELSEFPFATQLVPDAELVGAIIMDAAIIMLYFGFMRLSVWKREPRGQDKEADSSPSGDTGKVGNHDR